MKIKNLVLAFSVLVLFSCKNETINESSNSVKEEEGPHFKVTANLIVKKDDDFCLLFTEDGSINFKDKAVWKKVVGNEKEQLVEFWLPKDAYPSQLRLDFGINPEQEEIIIKSIKMEYGKNVRELKGNEISAFFRADDSKCTYDSNTGIIKPLTKEGRKQNCSLYPHESIQAIEIPKLAK